MTESHEYIFVGKSLYFPGKELLVIGDMHIGYEFMLRQSGVLIPERQVKDIIEDFKEIFNELKNKNLNVKKIVFLGDIKHAFGYEFQERNEFLEILDFLKEKVPEKNIIIVKGNHDTMDYTPGKIMKPYYIEGELFFAHGHQIFAEMFNPEIKIVVSGHLHPSVIIEENPGVKREAYKCFLVGLSRKKQFIVVPSFLGMVEGTPVNDYNEDYIESFSIIPKKDIMKFHVHVLSETGEIFDFGRIKDL